MKRPLHALAAAAALALGLALCPSPALASPAETDGIIVTMATGTDGISTLAESSSALEDAGLDVTGVVSAQGGELTLEARPTAGQTDEQALEAARDLPGVASAQLNYVYHIIEPVDDEASPAADAVRPQARTLREAILANDPIAQYSSPEDSPNQYWLYSARLVDAWTLARSNGVVTVALFDTGVTLDHPDLAGNLLTALAWDSYYERPLAQTQQETGTTDNGGHGTMVAGILSAVANNGVGVAGSSYNAKLLPVKVVNDDNGNTNTSALARAYAYLLNLVDEGRVSNVRVVNMSLGGYGDTFAEDDLLHGLIAEARSDYGILTVCAGGNGSNGQPLTEPCYPADYEECVSVTALETDGTNIYWSDYNQSKDISAPGRTIWTTSASGKYTASSGTSLAAPIVSGTVALMGYAEPNATPDEICEALYATATPVVDPTYDRTQTSGSHGALDAEAAVSYLQSHVTRFTDVAQGAWYYDAVMFVGENGIMNGYADGSGYFGAEDNLMRQDAAGLLYNYLSNGEVAAEHCGLSDVPEDAYYTDAVNWCVEQGIFHGYDDGTFGVNERITRQQLMGVIYNWAHEEGETVDDTAFLTFPDNANTESWAVDAVKWCLSKGIINGATQPDGTRLILPQSNITRAEVAGIISNAVQAGVL